ncbi:hypothetical protein SAMN04487996_12122 [Dyadobacter soli]|uniref:Uncharacterized protein n=1 Tax=Dyadobacter soli TaxID=659014 RepID=A0A1G7VVN5_9BACT|nr:hypothetical protein [Dyadobacter soli]SDG63842.1 hypothetical protein SAMN04487996_12122 [Dyadobacter soli]
MNLVQKLPLGLALASCMMMSSCSQEDVQVVGREQTPNTSSGLKVAANPNIPTTEGWPGDHSFATGWEKLTWVVPDNKQLYSVGTSTRTHLWGNPYLPWTKPLPQLTASVSNNAGNFVTVMYQKNVLNNSTSYSKMRTKINNLVPGKAYAFTLYTASTIRVKNGQSTQYSPGMIVSIIGNLAPSNGMGPDQTIIDLNGKEAEWVSKTITFVAQATEAYFMIMPYASTQYHNTHDQFFHYTHAFVPQNAITEIQ